MSVCSRIADETELNRA